MADPRVAIADALCVADGAARDLLRAHPASGVWHRADITMLRSHRLLFARILRWLDHAVSVPPTASTPAEYLQALRVLEASSDASVAAVGNRCRSDLEDSYLALTVEPASATLTVADVTPSGRDAVRIELEIPLQERKSFRHRPGQHVEVALRVLGVRVSRSYSLCTAEAGSRLCIGVRAQQPGLLSQRLQSVLVGDRVQVSPPTGTMVWPPATAPDAGRILLVAAGSGITPIAAILEAIVRDRPDLDVALVVIERQPADVMLEAQLRVAGDVAGDRLHRRDWWTSMTGRPTARDLSSLFSEAAPLGDVSAYRHVALCGPDGLMDQCLRVLSDAGYDGVSDRESFGRNESPPPSVAGRVTVRVDGQQLTIAVREGESVLAAMLREGIDQPYSCRTGTCHTCLVEVTDTARIWPPAIIDPPTRILACRASLVADVPGGSVLA